MIPINYGVLKPITLCCGCRLAHVHANLLQFNRSVMIDCLRPHGLQHAWPPCPSSISRIYPNSCPIMEKAMATHSSTLAWKIPWTEEPGRLQSMGSLRVGHDWATSLSFSLSCIGEGNGNPLQCSCLENPRDRGAWWAAIYGVTQSQTRLKWLSSSSMSNKSVMPSNHLIPSSPFPPAFNLSQHQGLFQWISSSHQVAKVLEFQLQHQSFQWIFRTDFL